MPLYEYRCKECGNTFEKLVLSEGEPITCPKGHGGVEKLMSSFSIEVPDAICAKLPRGNQGSVAPRAGGSPPNAS